MNKDTLVEIKKGQTGTGLLIESDGFMQIKETPFKMNEASGENGGYCPDPFIVDVVLQKFGIKNANGRIYPERVLKRQVDIYMEKIRNKNAIGETNHPAESVIDLSRTSINIVECHWEGHTLVGKMEILVSPGFRKHGIISCCADEIANLLLHGIKIGVSSRGLGTVSQEGGVLIVGDDYELVCWDVVSEPSTPGAWISTNGKEELTPYMESKENNRPTIDEKVSKIEKILEIL
jgi:hypothetical protein